MILIFVILPDHPIGLFTFFHTQPTPERFRDNRGEPMP